MKLIVATIVTLLIGSGLSAKDFSSEAFTVKDIENWLTEDLSIEQMKEAFGDTSMKLGPLELIEPSENKDEEIYAGTERYVYVIKSLDEKRFELEKNWTLDSPSISFRFSGAKFLGAFIMDPNPENLIRLEPIKGPENQSVERNE